MATDCLNEVGCGSKVAATGVLLLDLIVALTLETAASEAVEEEPAPEVPAPEGPVAE